MSLKAYINAIRPRTLFLAVASSICGSGLAWFVGGFNTGVFILTLVTASLLQILSNLANDYGDFQHGTDITGKRVGPVRALQSGAITPQRMKTMIVGVVLASTASGLALLYIALKSVDAWVLLVFLGLGIASIIAAIKYTAGNKPYGYRGLGDLFSFIFFGLVAVVGTYFLHTQRFGFLPWLPAVSLGFLTVAVLNVNNMRDMHNDKASGKITIPIMLGFKNAKIYHAFLTFGAMLCLTVFNMLYMNHWYQWLYMLVFVLLGKFLMDIFKITEHRKLDPYLKYTSMAIFLLAILFSVCINIE